MIVTEFMKNRVRVEDHADLSRLEWKYAQRLRTNGLNAAQELAHERRAD
jgi:hypothetical protein